MAKKATLEKNYFFADTDFFVGLQGKNYGFTGQNRKKRDRRQGLLSC